VCWVSFKSVLGVQNFTFLPKTETAIDEKVYLQDVKVITINTYNINGRLQDMYHSFT
jgi:hypothetical protein